MSYGICQECGADIIWALTMPGRNRMPVDPERYAPEDTRANLVAGRDHLGSLIVRTVTSDVEVMSNQWRAMPHFATCAARASARPAGDDAAVLAESVGVDPDVWAAANPSIRRVRGAGVTR